MQKGVFGIISQKAPQSYVSGRHCYQLRRHPVMSQKTSRLRIKLPKSVELIIFIHLIDNNAFKIISEKGRNINYLSILFNIRSVFKWLSDVHAELLAAVRVINHSRQYLEVVTRVLTAS